MHRVRRELFLPDDNHQFGKGVRVAVLDTGIDANHPDLSGRIDLVASRSFSRIDDLLDRNGHGTHVVGIIAGTGVESGGVYRGIAPASTIIVCKVLGWTKGQEFDAVSGVQQALAAGADIINYSHGFAPPTEQPPPWVWSMEPNFLEEGFIEAEARGVLCVVAAGNKGDSLSSITRPGGLEQVLTVGALAVDNTVAKGSGRGPYLRSNTVRAGGWARKDSPFHDNALKVRKPDIVLPGAQVTSLRSGHVLRSEDDHEDPRYTQIGGSSQAAAVASGLAAALLGLARENNIDLGSNHGRMIRRLMIAGARQLKTGSVTDYGAGTIAWPILQSALVDFAMDPQFRQRIIDGHDLELLE